MGLGTRIVLVRHGQASASRLAESGADAAARYDELSALGREQSRLVGRWLARWAGTPAHVLVGPRRRHVQTFEEAVAAARNGGVAWPDPVRLEALDEHHGIQLMHRVGPSLVSRADALGETARAAFASNDPQRAWMRVLREVMVAWARGEIDHDEVERWSAFRARVRTAIETARAGGGRVIAFTSGGVIGTAVAEVLGLDEVRTIELCWAVRNASVTELRVSSAGLSLSMFNSLGHFERPELITLV